MNSENRVLIINNIKLSAHAAVSEAFSAAKKILSSVGVCASGITFHVHKRSIDARLRGNILFVYSILCEGDIPVLSDALLKKISASYFEYSMPNTESGDGILHERPLIVGAGPAGLFAALMLAERGYRPIIVERGGDIKARNAAVSDFVCNGILDTNSNIQFGLGGAGTFSDGKLITRINDPLSSYVLNRLCEFGASSDILYNAKPHIGTDVLSSIVSGMADKIIELGGEIRYNTCFLGADFENKSLSVAKTSAGDIPCGLIILAPGHSARDTYHTLISSGLCVEAKSFSVGMRIEHLASEIDKAMYGDMAGDPVLGHAEYTLSHNTKIRGAYTFCMCPGGEVVAAASEAGGVVVNGMSNSKRDGRNSNSAVVVSVFKEDYGSTPMAAIDFQRNIERAAFSAAGFDYSAPIITVGDFLSGGLSKEPTLVIPTYRRGEHVKLVRPEKYLPEFVTNGLRSAILNFDKKIRGFADKCAVLSGAETRTSAPVRILRNSDTRLAIGYDNLYPVGEGAGYAGGITSAAIDGLKTALAIISKYRPILG